MASPKQKYSIFKPKDPNFNGGSSSSYGNRNKDVTTSLFPTTPNGDALYNAAEQNFKTAQVDTGDAQIWGEGASNGKVNLDYTGISGTDKTPPNTSLTQEDQSSKKVGPYIPNIDAKNISGNVDLGAYASNPGPTVDYNNAVAVDENSYNQQHGVYSPKASSDRTRVTLGDTLSKGKSKNT